MGCSCVSGFALSLQGLPPSRPHMNSLQRTWIFQGIDVQMHSDAGWDPGSVKDLLWCLSVALLFSCYWTRRLVETEAAVATLSWLWNSDVPQRLMKCGLVLEKALNFTSPLSVLSVVPFGLMLKLGLNCTFVLICGQFLWCSNSTLPVTGEDIKLISTEC